MKPSGLTKMSLLILLIAESSQALTLQEYLSEVQKRNNIFKSYEIQIEAAEDRRIGGDVSLVPVITAKGTVASSQAVPSLFGTKQETSEYSLGVSKKFSSGTTAGVSAKAIDYKVEGVAAPLNRFATSSLGVSLSQSLWKDFFGQGIRLRQSREEVVSQSEKHAAQLSQKQALINAENIYWDYLSSLEDLKNKKASLERAKKVDGWVTRRVSNGIADDADLLNARALVATREYQLTAAQDALLTAEKSIRENLVLDDKDPMPDLTGDITKTRGLLIRAEAGKKVVRLDAYLSYLEAKAKALAAQEVRDTYRPDLVLDGAYSTNVFEPTLSDATGHISQSDKPSTSVGLRLTWLFDTEVKEAAVSASSKDAAAARFRSERSLYESENSFSELKRKFAVLSDQIESAQKIAAIQARRVRAEQDRFSKGRSITSNVVTAEQEASEADLNLVKMQIAQRKLEAQSRLFLTFEESPL